MGDLDSGTRRGLKRLQRRWDRLKLGAKKRLRLFEPVEILGYRGQGRRDRLRVIGRVMERTGLREPERDGGLLRNIANTVRRLETDEIPGARVRGRFGDVVEEAVTDHEGFFQLCLRPTRPVEPGWHAVELELLESIAGGAGTRSTAEIVVPPADADFCVVSDLDDTVIRTGATDTMTELRIVFTNSATSRSPMPGAPALYRALGAGPERSGWNPFFYVSLSGWGLYDLFERFLDDHGLPKGPLFLQDLAVLEEKSRVLGSEDHKRDTILRLMDDYPGLPFVLIGDSGQNDPETYRDIVRERTDRVRAVLVRDVTPEERDREVRRVAQEVEDMGVPMAAAESSVSLARAAADFGLVHHDAIAAVRKAMVREEGD